MHIHTLNTAHYTSHMYAHAHTPYTLDGEMGQHFTHMFITYTAHRQSLHTQICLYIHIMAVITACCIYVEHCIIALHL